MKAFKDYLKENYAEYEERAAIREHEGNQDRDKAEQQAMAEMRKRFNKQIQTHQGG